MFYARQDSKAAAQPDSFTVRVSNASGNAAQAISNYATTAAAGISKGVQQGVYTTRVWAAPRLESAADYTTTTVAPKVSSALKSSAQQVRPVDVTQKKSHSVLTWSLLAAAIVATAGAVAALVRHRYNAVLAEDEVDEFADSTSGTTMAGTAGAAPAGTAPADSTTSGTDTGVNGRVSTSGW